MTQGVIAGRQDLLERVGQELGTSDWFEITQEKVDMFAEATHDRQWIHTDPEKARNGPFGTTVAHGYFTLGLAPVLGQQAMRVEGIRMGVNYGSNRVRYPAPVPVGSRVRVHVKLAAAEPVDPDGVQATFDMTFEVEGQTKPGCVAQVISRYYF